MQIYIPEEPHAPFLFKLLFFPQGLKLQGARAIPIWRPRGKQNWPFLWEQWASPVVQMEKILTADNNSDLRNVCII